MLCVCVCVCVCVCDCLCVCVCVFVCNIRLFDLKSIPYYSYHRIYPFSWTFHYPRYMPTLMSPLLYADYLTSSRNSTWPRLIPFFPELLPRFNPAKAREVPSPTHMSDQVAVGFALLLLEGLERSRLLDLTIASDILALTNPHISEYSRFRLWGRIQRYWEMFSRWWHRRCCCSGQRRGY